VLALRNLQGTTYTTIRDIPVTFLLLQNNSWSFGFCQINIRPWAASYTRSPSLSTAISDFARIAPQRGPAYEKNGRPAGSEVNAGHISTFGRRVQQNSKSRSDNATCSRTLSMMQKKQREFDLHSACRQTRADDGQPGSYSCVHAESVFGNGEPMDASR
jgi:hypothetical protein